MSDTPDTKIDSHLQEAFFRALEKWNKGERGREVSIIENDVIRQKMLAMCLLGAVLRRAKRAIPELEDYILRNPESKQEVIAIIAHTLFSKKQYTYSDEKGVGGAINFFAMHSMDGIREAFNFRKRTNKETNNPQTPNDIYLGSILAETIPDERPYPGESVLVVDLQRLCDSGELGFKGVVITLLRYHGISRIAMPTVLSGHGEIDAQYWQKLIQASPIKNDKIYDWATIVASFRVPPPDLDPTSIDVFYSRFRNLLN